MGVDISENNPAHSAPLRHINNFISFLRECGGFEIW